MMKYAAGDGHRLAVPREVVLILVLAAAPLLGGEPAAEDPEVQKLAQEVAKKGWLALSARSTKGNFDLLLARPDGSGLRNITQTLDFDEYGARFSSDGKKLLFRRLKIGTSVDHVDWGHCGVLVIANADGSNPLEQGQEGEFPWATWSPDGTQIACVYRGEGKIRIFDVQTKRLVREMPAQGIFRQLSWSCDGQRLCGPANFAGADWNIVSLEIETGKVTQVSRGMSCTPDWFPSDPLRVIYSTGVSEDNDQGWVSLMQATADGKSHALIYGERTRHIYGGCVSPDGQYVLFSRRVQNSGPLEGDLAIVRLADTPIIAPPGYPMLEAACPNPRRGPVLHLTGLPKGFEPHWTYAEIGP